MSSCDLSVSGFIDIDNSLQTRFKYDIYDFVEATLTPCALMYLL